MNTDISNRADSPLLRSDLAQYFRRFFKSEKKLLIGIEAELLGVMTRDGTAVTYGGPGGIEGVFSDLTKHFAWEPVQEAGLTIALKKGKDEIHLEPGGQLEFSCRPYGTLRESFEALQRLYSDLKSVSERKNISWLELGLRPFGKSEDIPWVPKFRYQLMKNFLQSRGKLAHRMMKETCTLQANLDYSSEKDAMRKMRTAMAVAPLMTGLFANSPFLEGKVQNALSLRAEAWLKTDPARCGLIPEILRDDPSFEDYVEHLLKIPMIFFRREEEWIDAEGITFDHFMQYGHKNYHATEDDWKLFLTTVFTDVRLNPFVELRFADRNRLDLNIGMAVFWKGLLYDSETCDQAWDLLKDWTLQERLELSRTVPVLGPGAPVRGKSVLEWGTELLNYAEQGLKRLSACGRLDEDETRYLEPVKVLLLEEKKCPAQRLIHFWTHEWHENPQKLIEYSAI
jgi:glutamate--cysteine ligase